MINIDVFVNQINWVVNMFEELIDLIYIDKNDNNLWDEENVRLHF
jgi:hypothetical protein